MFLQCWEPYPWSRSSARGGKRNPSHHAPSAESPPSPFSLPRRRNRRRRRRASPLHRCSPDKSRPVTSSTAASSPSPLSHASKRTRNRAHRARLPQLRSSPLPPDSPPSGHPSPPRPAPCAPGEFADLPDLFPIFFAGDGRSPGRPKLQRMRGDLLQLCADAEARLEARCSDALTALDDPLRHVRLFPFYDSYACLCDLEHRLLSAHAPDRLAGAAPARAAFLGWGSLPLSSLLLAARHMPDAVVDSFDRSPQMLKKPSHPSAAMISQLLQKKLLG